MLTVQKSLHEKNSEELANLARRSGTLYSKEYVTLLEKGDVIAFNKLRKSDGIRVLVLPPVSLRKKNLRGIDLGYTLARGIDFRGSNLTNANFERAYLPAADFRSYAGFGKTDLTDARFIKTILRKDKELESLLGYKLEPVQNMMRRHERGRYEADEAKDGADFRNSNIAAAISRDVDWGEVDLGYTKEMALIERRRFEELYSLILQKPDSTEVKGLETSGNELDKLLGVYGSTFCRKSAIVYGEFLGGSTTDFVNPDPKTVLVIQNFHTHGDVYSAGPIVTRGETHFQGNVISEDVIYFGERAFPSGIVVGSKIYLEPSVTFHQAEVALGEVVKL